jgi:hypothetical protein
VMLIPFGRQSEKRGGTCRREGNSTRNNQTNPIKRRRTLR